LNRNAVDFPAGEETSIFKSRQLLGFSSGTSASSPSLCEIMPSSAPVSAV